MSVVEHETTVRRDPPPGFDLKPMNPMGNDTSVKDKPIEPASEKIPEPAPIINETYEDAIRNIEGPKDDVEFNKANKAPVSEEVVESPQLDPIEEGKPEPRPDQSLYAPMPQINGYDLTAPQTQREDPYDYLPSEERAHLKRLLKIYGLRKVRSYLEVRMTVIQFNMNPDNAVDYSNKNNWISEAISRLSDKSLF